MSRLFESFLNRYMMVFLAVFVFAGLLWLSQTNYLMFHSLAELFSVLIAFTIFVLTWNARQFIDNGYLSFIGVAFLFIGGMDLMHTLSYRGMGVIPEDSSNIATQLWLAARFLQAGSMVAAPFFLRRKFSIGAVIVAYAALSVFFLLSIFTWKIFPVSYAVNAGLTSFKVVSEYTIMVLFIVSMVLLVRVRSAFEAGVLNLLLLSLGVNVLSEFFFSTYANVYDVLNLSGHFLKIVSFYLFYKAIVETGFRRPYDLLFRDLKQSEEALRESTTREKARLAQLEAIMDAVPAVVWISHDTQGHLITGNRASYEFMRLPINANQSNLAPGGKFNDHFRIYKDGHELAPHEQPMVMAATSGKPVRDFEETVLFNDGSRRQLYGNVTPLFDDLNRPSGAVAAFIDITERVNAEQALNESEQRYHNLFTTMEEGWGLLEILCDETGRAVDFQILDINPAFERITGLPRAQWVSKRIRQISPDIASSWIERFAHVAYTGEPVRFEDYSPFLGKYIEVMAYRPKEQQCAILLTDATQRRSDQMALRQSEARLRRLVDSNIIGIIQADADGNLQLANDAFLQLVGYTREEYEAGLLNWVNLTPPEYLPLDMKGIAEANQRGACTPYEKEYIHKDGHCIPVLIGYGYFKDATTPYYICFILDLTDRKQAEERLEAYALQLERSNRELQDFAFVASHDLQEPLRKISGFWRALEDAVGGAAARGGQRLSGTDAERLWPDAYHD